MNFPKDRKYSESHEWFLLDGDEIVMGITEHAAEELTDITFVELPEVGKTLDAGGVVGEVESVKATSELFTAIPGTVTAVNNELADHPELINDDPYEEGWIARIKPTSLSAMEDLMDSISYKKSLG